MTVDIFLQKHKNIEIKSIIPRSSTIRSTQFDCPTRLLYEDALKLRLKLHTNEESNFYVYFFTNHYIKCYNGISIIHGLNLCGCFLTQPLAHDIYLWVCIIGDKCLRRVWFSSHITFDTKPSTVCNLAPVLLWVTSVILHCISTIIHINPVFGVVGI